MPVTIDGKINEGETAWIDVVAHDVDGDSVTPSAMWYWWTDTNSNVINGRNKVAVSGGDLGATTVIIGGETYLGTAIELTPDDTKLSANYDAKRIFTVKYTYTSDRGADKTGIEHGVVTVEAVKMIPDISPSASVSPSESPSASPSLSPSASESPSISPS